MSDTDPSYLSLNEAASYLKTSISTLRGWARTKGLPYHKPGKELLFRQRDLDRWMDRYRHGLKGLALTTFTNSQRRTTC